MNDLLKTELKEEVERRKQKKTNRQVEEKKKKEEKRLEKNRKQREKYREKRENKEERERKEYYLQINRRKEFEEKIRLKEARGCYKQNKGENNLLFMELYKNPLLFFRKYNLSIFNNIDFPFFNDKLKENNFYLQIFEDFVSETDNFILFELLMSDYINTDDIDPNLDFISLIVNKLENIYTFRLLIFSNIEYLKETYDYIFWDNLFHM